MAEIAKKIQAIKVEEKPKRERRQDIPLKFIVPEPFKKTWRVVKLITMIPVSLIVGVFNGIIEGYVKGLETALEMYRKEMEK